MQITFNLHELSQSDVRGLQSLLACHLSTFGTETPLPQLEAPQPAVGQNTGSSQPGAAPSPGDAAVAEDSVPRTSAESSVSVKRGPGRPKKDKAADSVTLDAAPAAGSSVAVIVTPPSDTAAPTMDNLRDALGKLTNAKGLPAGIELLKSFDCQRISEMAAKDLVTQLKFIAQCEVA